jgi:hypothetical protein
MRLRDQLEPRVSCLSTGDPEQDVLKGKTSAGAGNPLIADGQEFLQAVTGGDRDEGGTGIPGGDGEARVISSDETGKGRVSRFQGGNAVYLEPDREPVMKGVPQPPNTALGLGRTGWNGAGARHFRG